jgi:plasmid stabilization system protein ParE
MDDPPDRQSKIELKPAAITDLEEIEDFVARKSGPVAAEALSNSILERCYLLAIMPNAGTRQDEIAPGIRSVTAQQRYVIYYEVSSDKVTIVRIRHGSRDIDNFFR